MRNVTDVEWVVNNRKVESRTCGNCGWKRQEVVNNRVPYLCGEKLQTPGQRGALIAVVKGVEISLSARACGRWKEAGDKIRPW